MKSALVLFAHGARDPDWAVPFQKIREIVSARRPDLAVELAFLELMQPSLPDAVGKLAAQGCRSITIAPLFMAQGAHLKRDLPALVAALGKRHPDVALSLLPAAGEADSVLRAIGDWLVASLPQSTH